MLFYGQLLIKHKLLYLKNYYFDLLLPIITPIISNFQHVLVLIRAFQKYYGLSRYFLLTSAFFAFLSKLKPYSRSYRAISFMKYYKTGIKDILFSFHLVKKY